MRVGAGAADLRAHRDQESREVDDLGLARGVFDDGLAFGERRGHHQVFGAGDGHGFEHQPRAAQPLGARADVAVLDLDVGAHRAAGPRRGCSPAARRSRSRPATTHRPCRSAPAAARARGSKRASSAPARTERRTRGSCAASTSTRMLSSIVTLTPMRPSSSIMVVTSCRCGTLPTDTGAFGQQRARRESAARRSWRRKCALRLRAARRPWICSLSIGSSACRARRASAPGC